MSVEAATGPTFAIIGAARSGTSALASALGRHPDIFMSTPKEPHFFAFANQAVNFTGPGDDWSVNRVSITDPDAYEALFTGAELLKARGEGSVSSLYYSEASLMNIRKYAPDLRVVVVLRDPVDRAYSAWQYLRARGLEPVADFEEALQAEPARIEAGWHHLWHYRAMSHYSEDLNRFIAELGSERVRVWFFDDLEQRPEQVATGTHEFLGVAPDGSLLPGRTNVSGEARVQTFQRAIQFLTRQPRLRAAIRTATPGRARELVRKSSLRPTRVSPEARRRVAPMFEEDLTGLRALLGHMEQPSWLSNPAR